MTPDVLEQIVEARTQRKAVALVTALDREGFAVNSGSSCTASTLEPSHVLVAMGVLTHGNVRVSLPRGVETAEVAGAHPPVGGPVPPGERRVVVPPPAAGLGLPNQGQNL